ncbi:hypothetical protein [Escherichia coli]|nr:hypothetical protein [Escherichia coli]
MPDTKTAVLVARGLTGKVTGE